MAAQYASVRERVRGPQRRALVPAGKEPIELGDSDESDEVQYRRLDLDRMEPWPCGRRRPVVGGEWSAPAHLSWVAGWAR